MQEYVLGFLFSTDKKRVVLIEKQKPEWQAGALNGVGGKIEDNENPYQAMVREFKEETGLFIDNWLQFSTLKSNHNLFDKEQWVVYCYVAFGDVDQVQTMENEIVYIVKVSELPTLKVIQNLQWLIPLALDTDEIFTNTIYK